MTLRGGDGQFKLLAVSCCTTVTICPMLKAAIKRLPGCLSTIGSRVDRLEHDLQIFYRYKLYSLTISTLQRGHLTLPAIVEQMKPQLKNFFEHAPATVIDSPSLLF